MGLRSGLFTCLAKPRHKRTLQRPPPCVSPVCVGNPRLIKFDFFFRGPDPQDRTYSLDVCLKQPRFSPRLIAPCCLVLDWASVWGCSWEGGGRYRLKLSLTFKGAICLTGCPAPAMAVCRSPWLCVASLGGQGAVHDATLTRHIRPISLGL